jgi:hypothetical protein
MPSSHVRHHVGGLLAPDVYPDARFVATRAGVEQIGSFGLAESVLGLNPGAVGTITLGANASVIVPFVLNRAFRIAKMGAVVNTKTAATNIDLGIYDAAFALLCSTGSIDGGASNTIVWGNVTAVTLRPGLYYFAMASDGGNTTYNAASYGLASVPRATGSAQMASAFPLPSTYTPAVYTGNVIPMILASTAAFA